jgi:hypothetical protein
VCTIGTYRIGVGDYLVFKNKDFPRPSFEDRIIVDDDVFGIAGVSTWRDPEPGEDHFSGMSVGANAAGLLCADANVQGATGLSSYDELVETALRAGGGVTAGIAAIEDAVAKRAYLWGNIVMIDGERHAVVEVRGNTVDVAVGEYPVVRTNHHLRPSQPDDPAVSPTSEPRLAAAQRRLDAATDLADIFELLRAHDDGPTGICNHLVSQTVYSYVLRRHRENTRLYVTKGHPCRAGQAVELEVPLGERWSPVATGTFAASYPSGRAGESI